MSKILSNMSQDELESYMHLAAKATSTILPTKEDGITPCEFILIVFDKPDCAQIVAGCRVDQMFVVLKDCLQRISCNGPTQTWGDRYDMEGD